MTWTMQINMPPSYTPDEITSATLGIMGGLTIDAILRSARVQRVARMLAAAADGRGVACPLYIFTWMRERFRFSRDPMGYENLRLPEVVIDEALAAMNAGLGRIPIDCDDSSMVCASLLGALGYQPGFAVVARPERPNQWAHVFCVIDDRGTYVPFDPQETGAVGAWPAKLRLAVARV